MQKDMLDKMVTKSQVDYLQNQIDKLTKEVAFSHKTMKDIETTQEDQAEDIKIQGTKVNDNSTNIEEMLSQIE